MKHVLLLVTLLLPLPYASAQEGAPANEADPPTSEGPPAEPPARHAFENPSVPLEALNDSADPRVMFQNRALTLTMRRGDVQVMRAGHKVRDEELRLLTSSNKEMAPRWEAMDSAERRTDVIMAAGIGGCLAAPACGGILGAVFSVAALQAYAVITLQKPEQRALANVSTLVAGALGGVCLGCLTGGLILPAALGTTMVVDAASDDELKPEEYARLVTRYNHNLAHNLGLDPSALDPIYFPSDGMH